MSHILRSVDVKGALKARQRGFILNPYRYAQAGGFPSSGLVSYYKLDANSNDSLGVNNGTDTTVSYANAGIQGNSATFAPGRIALTAGAPPTNTSVSFWFRRSAAGSAEEFIYGWYANDGIVYWRIGLSTFNAGALTLGIRSATSDFKFWDIANLVTDTTTFHHAVVTQAGTADPIIYLDGTSRAITLRAVSGTMAKWTGTVPHSIGRTVLSGNPHLPYSGRIDEVGLWNRILSAAEVTTLWNSGLGITYP